MNATCFIVSAAPDGGNIYFQPRAGDLVIAADGGFAYLEKMNITPDAIVGDFDSLGYIPAHANVLPFPAEKDDTDTMLAIRYGLQKGYLSFDIYGGLGGRMDHTIANIQALTYLARNGARGKLIDRDTCATVICSGSIELDAAGWDILSVFALDGEVHGVTMCGFKYPLNDATLTNAFPIGVSNEFAGEKGIVSVCEGALLIILQKIGPDR